MLGRKSCVLSAACHHTKSILYQFKYQKSQFIGHPYDRYMFNFHGDSRSWQHFTNMEHIHWLSQTEHLFTLMSSWHYHHWFEVLDKIIELSDSSTIYWWCVHHQPHLRWSGGHAWEFVQDQSSFHHQLSRELAHICFWRRLSSVFQPCGSGERLFRLNSRSYLF